MKFEIMHNLLDVDLILKNILLEIFLQQLLLYHQEHLIFEENQLITIFKNSFFLNNKLKNGFSCKKTIRSLDKF